MRRLNGSTKTGAEIDGVAPCCKCGSTMINRSGLLKDDMWFAECMDCGYKTEKIKTHRRLVEFWNSLGS